MLGLVFCYYLKWWNNIVCPVEGSMLFNNYIKHLLLSTQMFGMLRSSFIFVTSI